MDRFRRGVGNSPASARALVTTTTTTTTTTTAATKGNNGGGGDVTVTQQHQHQYRRHQQQHAGRRKRESIGRAAESFQSMLYASFKSVRRKGAGGRTSIESPFLAALVSLPSELHVQILSSLCIADLLSLRLTCRALHDLITSCGSALVRHWVRHKMGTLHIRLYPPPLPNSADLPYLLAMRRRHIASVRLTRELARFVLADTLQHTSERQRQMWASVYEKMIPLVFGVGYFLEEHRRAILERDLGRIRPRSHIGYDICTAGPITAAERAILLRLDPPLRLQFFYMYCFILQVLTRKLRPPPSPSPTATTAPTPTLTTTSHSGTATSGDEKALLLQQGGGWAAKPACAEDVAFVLVLGGVGQVAKLVGSNSFAERRRLLDGFITRLSPHESGSWRKHWRDVGVTSPALLDDIPCSTIRITALDQIWEPLIKDAMGPGSREFTASEKVRFAEVMASRNFLNEIMGYDILRGRPPVEEEDSDDEDNGRARGHDDNDDDNDRNEDF